MNTALRKLGLVCAVLLPLGCSSSVSEIGPAKTTSEMTKEEEANMKKGMEESLKHMPKSQRAKYQKYLKNKTKEPK
ncbi:MAG: hypothetical protein ACE5KM_17700 [Planctomycetaceae bacterium]